MEGGGRERREGCTQGHYQNRASIRTGQGDTCLARASRCLTESRLILDEAECAERCDKGIDAVEACEECIQGPATLSACRLRPPPSELLPFCIAEMHSSPLAPTPSCDKLAAACTALASAHSSSCPLLPLPPPPAPFLLDSFLLLSRQWEDMNSSGVAGEAATRVPRGVDKRGVDKLAVPRGVHKIAVLAVALPVSVL